jgi:hypothetical protein
MKLKVKKPEISAVEAETSKLKSWEIIDSFLFPKSHRFSKTGSVSNFSFRWLGHKISVYRDF